MMEACLNMANDFFDSDDYLICFTFVWFEISLSVVVVTLLSPLLLSLEVSNPLKAKYSDSEGQILR